MGRAHEALYILEILAISYAGNHRKIESQRHKTNYTLFFVQKTCKVVYHYYIAKYFLCIFFTKNVKYLFYTTKGQPAKPPIRHIFYFIFVTLFSLIEKGKQRNNKFCK